MPNGLINLALGIAMQVGSPGPSEAPGFPALPTAYGRYGSEGSSELRYPFDIQRNWVHGYYQELPSYGGYPVMRPYNYKHVLSQSQTAAGWGERPMMPYSQQFWHKYHDQATMIKTSHAAPIRTAPGFVYPQPTSTSPVYVGWSTPAGSEIVLPPTAAPMHSLPAQPIEIVNPTAYRSSPGRGF